MREYGKNEMNNIAEVQSPESYSSQLLIASFLLGVLFAPLSLAQHEMHDLPANGVHFMQSLPGPSV